MSAPKQFRDFGSVNFNIKNYGAEACIVQAGGVRQTKTPRQNSDAIKELIENVYGYHGRGKLTIPAIGRIDLEYATIVNHHDFTFEGFGAGSWLHNASIAPVPFNNPALSGNFWEADVFIVGNMGESNYPRLWNDSEFRSVLTTVANSNKITLANSADVAALQLSAGKVVLITSYEWVEPALLASTVDPDGSGPLLPVLRYTPSEAAAHAVANTGIMNEDPDFTPLFSDLNEVMRIDGADIYLRYPIPFSVTTPKICNMDKQNIELSGNFGGIDNPWFLRAIKNVTIRNMKLSTNPANGNGMGIQASSMLGCLFENLEIDARGILYGNLQCHSVFRNINGRFYDTFADLKVGPYDMLYEDITGLLVPRPEFTQDYNVLWSPDVRASYTVFNRVKCYAIGHPGHLRLGGRHMTYRDCEFFSSATETIVIPSGSSELPPGVGNPENQIVHFRKIGHPNTALRHFNASGGRDIDITIDEMEGTPSTNLGAFATPAENIRIKMPIYTNASLAVSTGINCWVEEIMPRGSYRRRVNPGSITSPTANNVVRTETIRANTISKNSELEVTVSGRFATVVGANVRLLINGVEAGLVTGSGSERFEMKLNLYARTETTNQEWVCVSEVGAISNQVNAGQLTLDVSASDFTIELQAWRTSGTLTIGQFEIETIPAFYSV
jgi:hypothetical protein